MYVCAAAGRTLIPAQGEGQLADGYMYSLPIDCAVPIYMCAKQVQMLLEWERTAQHLVGTRAVIALQPDLAHAGTYSS